MSGDYWVTQTRDHIAVRVPTPLIRRVAFELRQHGESVTGERLEAVARLRACTTRPDFGVGCPTPDRLGAYTIEAL